MKLADFYTASAHMVPDNDLYEHYQKFILDCLRDPSDRDPYKERINQERYEYELSKEEKEFFEEYYVPQGSPIQVSNHTILNDIFNDKPHKILGAHVKDILDFTETPKNLGLLIAQIGSGKTVLLRYMWFYLIGKSDYLQKKFIPIYISIDHNKNLFQGIDSEEAIRKIFIEAILHQRLVGVAQPFTDLDDENFWDYIKKGSDKFRTLEKYEKDLRKIYPDDIQNLNKLIYQKRMEIQDSKEFYYVALKFIREKCGKIPLLLLDNVDTLSLEVNRVIFEEAIALAEEFNIKILISMRTTTYSKIEECVDGSFHAHPPAIIKIELPNVKEYIKLRVRGGKKKMSQSKPLFEYINYEGNVKITFQDGIKVIEAMLDVLLTEDSTNFLSHIAFYNLRKINYLIKLYLSSGYIDEHLLVKKILNLIISDEKRYERSPLWILLSSVITHNHKTRFSEMGDDYEENVFNLYCNGRRDPGEYLLRIHILNFAKRHRDLSLHEIYETYSKLFTNVPEKLQSNIKYAVWRLLNFDLLESPDYYKVPNLEDIERIKSLHITDTGNYYRQELRNFYEYLVYMKDDIEISDNSYEIKDCIKVEDLTGRYCEVSKFLSMLFDVEKKFLFGLTQKQRTFFNTNFSNPTDSNPFIVAAPIKSLIDFAKIIRPDRLKCCAHQLEELSIEVSKYVNIFAKTTID